MACLTSRVMAEMEPEPPGAADLFLVPARVPDIPGCVPLARGRDPGPGRYSERMDSYWVAVFWSLLPTVVVTGLFLFALRSILRADRTERRVYARVEAKERAKRGLPPASTTSEL